MQEKLEKIVLIQNGQLDNQNPNFCMGWPGFYLLDNINQLGEENQIHINKITGEFL